METRICKGLHLSELERMATVFWEDVPSQVLSLAVSFIQSSLPQVRFHTHMHA